MISSSEFGRYYVIAVNIGYVSQGILRNRRMQAVMPTRVKNGAVKNNMRCYHVSAVMSSVDKIKVKIFRGSKSEFC